MVAVAKRIALYDTTLRDGTQGAGVTLSAEDKLRIADRLDEFGIDYIENVVEASWQALVDSLEYVLLRERVGVLP